MQAAAKSLLPGLWDTHTRVADESHGQLFRADGVTGVRRKKMPVGVEARLAATQ